MSHNFFKYHSASGTIICRLSLILPEHVHSYKQAGFDFLETEDESLDYWVDPLTKELHPLISATITPSVYGTPDETVVLSVPKPSWVIVEGDEPRYIEDGTVEVHPNPNNPYATQSMKLAGSYKSGFTLIYRKDIGELIALAKEKVDKEAEEARAAIQTPGSGQAVTYLRKADAARAYLNNQTLSEAQIARLQDEADRMGVSLEEAATSIITIADNWENADVRIDSLRLATKAKLNAATTGSEVTVILSELSWS